MKSNNRPNRPLTKEERDEIREGIERFCSFSRSVSDVAEHFGISGISAGAFLSDLVRKGKLESFKSSGKWFYVGY